MFTVFKIKHPDINSVYIGYCQRDDVSPVDHFLKGATRSDDRKDVEFLSLCEPSQLTHVVVSDEDDEWAAFNARNVERARDPHSFTGPSMWPAGAYQRAQQQLGDAASQPFERWKALERPTAREAYEAGAWTFEQIKLWSSAFGRDAVRTDLQTLTPRSFAEKYERVV